MFPGYREKNEGPPNTRNYTVPLFALFAKFFLSRGPSGARPPVGLEAAWLSDLNLSGLC